MRISPAQAVGCVNQEGLDQSLGSKITHTFKSGTDKARPTITVVLEDPFSRNLELLLAGERDQRRRLAGDRVLFPLFVRRHTSVDRRGLHCFSPSSLRRRHQRGRSPAVAAAYYEIDEDQARVVRQIFEMYRVQSLSIGAIARLMNEQAVPTCKRRGRWERSTVWGMLRNPAYKGEACFGKTTTAPRQRITRPVRMRGGVATRNSAGHERARED